MRPSLPLLPMASQLASYRLPLLPRPISRLPLFPANVPRAPFSTSLSLRLPRQTETRRAVTAQLPVLTLQEPIQTPSTQTQRKNATAKRLPSVHRIRFLLSKNAWLTGGTVFFHRMRPYKLVFVVVPGLLGAAFCYWVADGLEDRWIRDLFSKCSLDDPNVVATYRWNFRGALHGEGYDDEPRFALMHQARKETSDKFNVMSKLLTHWIPAIGSLQQRSQDLLRRVEAWYLDLTGVQRGTLLVSLVNTSLFSLWRVALVMRSPLLRTLLYRSFVDVPASGRMSTILTSWMMPRTWCSWLGGQTLFWYCANSPPSYATANDTKVPLDEQRRRFNEAVKDVNKKKCEGTLKHLNPTAPLDVYGTWRLPVFLCMANAAGCVCSRFTTMPKYIWTLRQLRCWTGKLTKTDSSRRAVSKFYDQLKRYSTRSVSGSATVAVAVLASSTAGVAGERSIFSESFQLNSVHIFVGWLLTSMIAFLTRSNIVNPAAAFGGMFVGFVGYTPAWDPVWVVWNDTVWSWLPNAPYKAALRSSQTFPAPPLGFSVSSEMLEEEEEVSSTEVKPLHSQDSGAIEGKQAQPDSDCASPVTAPSETGLQDEPASPFEKEQEPPKDDPIASTDPVTSASESEADPQVTEAMSSSTEMDTSTAQQTA